MCLSSLVQRRTSEGGTSTCGREEEEEEEELPSEADEEPLLKLLRKLPLVCRCLAVLVLLLLGFMPGTGMDIG
jgi:hypothetical protein